jgi:hypothetical protein
MCNNTAVAKAFVIAARTLAIALLTIGMGVNSTWAGSDQPFRIKFTPISSKVVFQPVTAAGNPHRSITMPRTAQACLPNGAVCSKDEDCCSNRCAVLPETKTCIPF